MTSVLCAAEPPDPDDAMALELIAADLRWLDTQRRSARSSSSIYDLLRAYDERLRQAGTILGITEHLDHLDGLDRDIERVRLEGEVQATGIAAPAVVLEATQDAIDNERIRQYFEAAVKRGRRLSLSAPAAAPAPAAVRLTDTVVRFLPSAHRARYGEEFRSELFELAAAGASIWGQLAYVACQFNMVFELRAELRRPARRKAGP